MGLVTKVLDKHGVVAKVLGSMSKHGLGCKSLCEHGKSTHGKTFVLGSGVAMWSFLELPSGTRWCGHVELPGAAMWSFLVLPRQALL